LTLNQEKIKEIEEKEMNYILLNIPNSQELLTLAGFEKLENNSFTLPENIPNYVLNSFLESIREQVFSFFHLFSRCTKDQNSTKVLKFKIHILVQIADEIFNITTRYEIIKVLGRGISGLVVEAFDKIQNKKVAIKKISNNFETPQDQKKVLREIKVLNHFK
jgi:hypothetical protein